jgi:hypothetical protein
MNPRKEEKWGTMPIKMGGPGPTKQYKGNGFWLSKITTGISGDVEIITVSPEQYALQREIVARKEG